MSGLRRFRDPHGSLDENPDERFDRIGRWGSHLWYRDPTFGVNGICIGGGAFRFDIRFSGEKIRSSQADRIFAVGSTYRDYFPLASRALSCLVFYTGVRLNIAAYPHSDR